MFAREHNRIVNLLPSSLSQEDKLQIARRIVISEEQYITYQAWLPAMGVALPKYTGYKSSPALSPGCWRTWAACRGRATLVSRPAEAS